MTSKNFVLAMEYCDGGSLYSMLDQPRYFYGLPEEEFLIVLYDIGKVTDSIRESSTIFDMHCACLILLESMPVHVFQTVFDWHMVVLTYCAWSSNPHDYYITVFNIMFVLCNFKVSGMITVIVLEHWPNP